MNGLVPAASAIAGSTASSGASTVCSYGRPLLFIEWVNTGRIPIFELASVILWRLISVLVMGIEW